jgi:tight adherence protein C
VSAVLVLAIGCLGAAAYLGAQAVTAPSRQRRRAVGRAASYGRVVLTVGDRRSFRERIVAPAAASLARLVLRLSPKTSVEDISIKLIAAGLQLSPQSFLAAKGAAAVGGAVFGLVFGGAAGSVGTAFFFALIGAVLGYMVPEFLVGSRARNRREQIRGDLPDALDLLAVSVEAGLGFDGAISKITEHTAGPLSDEFALALNEIRIGESRADALKKVAQRTDAPEVAAFTRAIIQADQLGISLGRILRVQAADTRNRRQAAAEEKAMKAPVKMLFPTVLFIFPTMFIVILGPALLTLLTVFK